MFIRADYACLYILEIMDSGLLWNVQISHESVHVHIEMQEIGKKNTFQRES